MVYWSAAPLRKVLEYHTDVLGLEGVVVTCTFAFPQAKSAASVFWNNDDGLLHCLNSKARLQCLILVSFTSSDGAACERELQCTFTYARRVQPKLQAIFILQMKRLYSRVIRVSA